MVPPPSQVAASKGPDRNLMDLTLNMKFLMDSCDRFGFCDEILVIRDVFLFLHLLDPSQFSTVVLIVPPARHVIETLLEDRTSATTSARWHYMAWHDYLPCLIGPCPIVLLLCRPVWLPILAVECNFNCMCQRESIIVYIFSTIACTYLASIFSKHRIEFALLIAVCQVMLKFFSHK